MKADFIKFNLEGSVKACAFFALYAGLRMYYDQKTASITEPGKVSIPAAEAYGMLQQLKEKHPKEFADAEDEYDEVYG